MHACWHRILENKEHRWVEVSVPSTAPQHCTAALHCTRALQHCTPVLHPSAVPHCCTPVLYPTAAPQCCPHCCTTQHCTIVMCPVLCTALYPGTTAQYCISGIQVPYPQHHTSCTTSRHFSGYTAVPMYCQPTLSESVPALAQSMPILFPCSYNTTRRQYSIIL